MADPESLRAPPFRRACVNRSHQPEEVRPRCWYTIYHAIPQGQRLCRSATACGLYRCHASHRSAGPNLKTERCVSRGKALTVDTVTAAQVSIRRCAVERSFWYTKCQDYVLLDQAIACGRRMVRGRARSATGGGGDSSAVGIGSGRAGFGGRCFGSPKLGNQEPGVVQETNPERITLVRREET